MAPVDAAAAPLVAAAAAVAVVEGRLQSLAVQKCYWCLPGQGGPVALALGPCREVQQPCPWRLQGEGGGPVPLASLLAVQKAALADAACPGSVAGRFCLPGRLGVQKWP